MYQEEGSSTSKAIYSCHGKVRVSVIGLIDTASYKGFFTKVSVEKIGARTTLKARTDSSRHIGRSSMLPSNRYNRFLTYEYDPVKLLSQRIRQLRKIRQSRQNL